MKISPCSPRSRAAAIHPRPVAIALVSLLALFAVHAAVAAPSDGWTFRELDPVETSDGAAQADVELRADDGTAEGAFGVGLAAARQFLWFQRYEPPSDFDLQLVQVLFPSDPQIVPGAEIEIVIYRDIDGDPATGAELLASRTEAIQFADGITFSSYPLEPEVAFRGGGSVYIGVVNRYVDSGTTPSHEPAALDTSSSEGNSWVATWTGDPPEPPELPPDQTLFMIDDLVAGNWMIRAAGRDAPVTDIPTLSLPGLALLSFVLALSAVLLLRPRRLGRRV